MADAKHILRALIAISAVLSNAGCVSAGTDSGGGASNSGAGASGEAAATFAADAGVPSNQGPGLISLLPELTALVEQQPGRVFAALLRPLNAGVNGAPVRGLAAVSVQGDVLDVVVVAKGLAPDMEHLQHIHGFLSGAIAVCPGSAADVNQDGVIDVLEGVPSYGPILVPLDSDLNDLNPQTFPTASSTGVVRYEQKGSVSAIERGLRAPLDLEKRIIALHGVAATTPLPPTTQTLPGLTPNVTLPVACGELVLVK